MLFKHKTTIVIMVLIILIAVGLSSCLTPIGSRKVAPTAKPIIIVTPTLESPNIPNSGLRLLSDTDGDEATGLAWSPDNKTLVVARQKYSEGGDPPIPVESYIDFLEVEKLSSYTLEKTRSTGAFATITGVCWSSNRNQIAFARFDSIWLVNLDNEQAPIRLGEGEACAWSKDGKTLAIIEAIKAEDQSLQTSKIYTLDVSTGEKQDVLQSTRLRDSIAWAPGSKRLAFVENYLPSATINTSNATLVTLDLDSGTRKMPISSDEIFSPTWSPDGTMLAITTISYHSTASLYDPKLMIIKAADGSILWESSVPDALYPITWSPDGKTIAFAHKRAIYALDVDALLKNK